MDVKKFGKYEIIEKIGQGGMGEVFKARDPVLKRDVAIKTISAGVSGDDDLRSRFEREAQLAAGLNHPNIVHIYDFGEEGGKIYMAMELLLGRDLKIAIKKNLLPSLDEKLALMEDVCEGLAFAHFREIVHRDLKPANIHIQSDGRAKIMDFGLAKLESSDMTRTGVIMGTPDYMSPEQVQGGKADARSDVYSMGAVFYELLTGRRPFTAESTHALLFQVLYNQPESVTKHNPEIPLAVQGIVERAMSKDAVMRFQNGGEMRDALRLARQGLRGESDATLVADISLGPSDPATPAGYHTPHPGSGPFSPHSGGMPRTPVSGSPGSPMPISGGPSGYPHPMTPGGGVGSQGSPGQGSMGAGSQGFGSYSQPTVIVQKSYTGLVVGISVAAIAVIAAVLYAMGALPGFPKEDPAIAQQQMANLQAQMIQRDLDGIQEAFTQKNFDRALPQIERVLEKDPKNSEALRIRDGIMKIRGDLKEMAAAAQASIDSGDTAGAAATVGRMLELEPGYQPALALSSVLSDQFRGDADSSRDSMLAARRRAEQTQGASALASFINSASVAGEAEGLYNSGKFGLAAAKYRVAAQGFDTARAEAQQIAQRRPEKKNDPVPPPPDPGEAQSARKAMQTARGRAEAVEGAKALGSFAQANLFQKDGDTYFGQGNYPLAASRFQAAADAFEAARQEAARSASQKPVVPPPQPQPSTPVQVPEPAQAKPVDERPAIEKLVHDYALVFETQDMDLYRRIKPNLSPDEAEALDRLFKRVKSYEVAVEINSVEVRGTSATAVISRQDTMNGKPSGRISQKLFLSKAGDRWIIESLGQ
jgi:serine/threonine protein kinase/tetratricopeptide (TPR) repeat protein